MILPHFALEDQVTSWNLIFVKNNNNNNNTVPMPFLLPSQFTSFHVGQGKVEKGQLMVMESCFNGMRNV